MIKSWRKDFLIHTNFLIIITISLLYYYKKVVFPYEYMDDWEKFNETTLPEKEDFYSNLKGL